MSTNWLAPTGINLGEVVNWDMLKKAIQNLDPTALPPGNNIDWNDPDNPQRADKMVQTVIQLVRGAIQNGGRTPLSVTPNAVPPMAYLHVLNLAAWQLINSTPNLGMIIYTDKGPASTFAGLAREAQAFITSLRDGNTAETPTDPAGQDYLTAVSDTNPAISSVDWGDLEADDTDYAQGFVTTADGVRIQLPVDDMRTF